jgi:superfamily II DNA helicase RecQ
MQLKFYQIPAGGSEPVEEEINAFLRAHRILKIDRELIHRDTFPSWALCVEYLESAGPRERGAAGQHRRVDYKEVLSGEDFSVFSALRDMRRVAAEAEGVPMYAVFTNEQLAKIAQQRPTSRAELEKVDGIGSSRGEKYGDRVLEIVAAAPRPQP